MSKETVDVTVDKNEAAQNPELTEILALHQEINNYREESLPEGDIKIHNCLFERKTPSDFASSLQEGRLREQVERMGGRDIQSFLLIEGDMSDFDGLYSNMSSKSLRGMVSSIAARNRIQVIFCSNAKLLADTAVRIARKVTEEPTSIQTTTADNVKDPTFIENMLMGVEGVGYKTAQKIAEEFSTVDSLIDATSGELQSTKGVGKVMADKIVNTLHALDSNGSEDEENPTCEVYSV